jgi:hypothetical protein
MKRTALVNNSNNIKKANNHLLSSLNTKNIATYDIRNPGLALNWHKTEVVLNRLMEFQISPQDNWIVSGITYKKK